MSLKKKIIFSFFISAFIIAVLAVFEYVNYHQIRDEMRFLEVTDTVRSKSLQLRRHEKNFFLYAGEADEERKAIYDYLAQLEDVTASLSGKDNAALHALVLQYRTRFDHILELKKRIDKRFDEFKPAHPPHELFASLVEASIFDRPVFVADFLTERFSLPPDHPLIKDLQELGGEIAALRRHGEDIIAGSKKLDTQARVKAEHGLHISQIAILIVFPLFLLIGLVALFSISSDVVRRLRTLTDAVEKTGERYMPSVPEPEHVSLLHSDEVGVLLEKFLRMDKQLEHWEEELKEKNRELVESKKLAAIGTLASGVAHELNNPLNNIFLSVQVLQRQMAGTASPEVNETLEDIAGQTTRVKSIVSDLLEFAREREPHLTALELNTLVTGAYNQVRKSMDASNVRLCLDLPSHSVIFWADRSMFERVFINLFTNAVAAMEEGGELVVKAEEQEDALKIWVSDTGKGMSEEIREKIFDPFFTRRERGTGLGLAIVLNIIKKHHGTISVVSEENEGTAFEITLPKEKMEG